MTLALDLVGLVHRYGRSYVLRGANLRLGRGEVLALYGANGAGKTTLLRIIATALTPTRGGGTVLGSPLKERESIRSRTLIVSHALGLYPDLDGPENLEFSVSMHRGSLPRARLEAALERVGLGGVKTRVRGYSSGMRKRLALAKVLLLEPELVLLDEPFAALDPDGKNLVEDILRAERSKGTTLIVSSHEPERTAQLATLEVTLEDGLLGEPTPSAFAKVAS